LFHSTLKVHQQDVLFCSEKLVKGFLNFFSKDARRENFPTPVNLWGSAIARHSTSQSDTSSILQPPKSPLASPKSGFRAGIELALGNTQSNFNKESP
jgi:hypothetical protein